MGVGVFVRALIVVLGLGPKFVKFFIFVRGVGKFDPMFLFSFDGGTLNWEVEREEEFVGDWLKDKLFQGLKETGVPKAKRDFPSNRGGENNPIGCWLPFISDVWMGWDLVGLVVSYWEKEPEFRFFESSK